jgi:CRISPR-associated protein (TIGR03984 family)
MTDVNELNKVLKRKTHCMDKGDIDGEDIRDFLLRKSPQLHGPVYLLVYKHHEISIGVIRQGEICIEHPEQLTPQYLKELRMFSKNGELYLWNQAGNPKYRLRIDEGEGSNYIYDEEHIMWGDKPDENDECAVEETNRGMRLKFPFPVNNKKRPFKYRVRNYLQEDEKTGILSFFDARLMYLLDAQGEEF